MMISHLIPSKTFLGTLHAPKQIFACSGEVGGCLGCFRGVLREISEATLGVVREACSSCLEGKRPLIK